MNKTEFHNGWSIIIFDVGLPNQSNRMMMAMKGMMQIDFDGYVAPGCDEQAFAHAKKFIDAAEKSGGMNKL